MNGISGNVWRTMVASGLVAGLTFATAAQEAKPAGVQTSRVVVVSIPDRKLAVIEGSVVLATFDVSVGAHESPSPTGEFRIVNRISNPTYYRPGIVIPAGKTNPIGTRWVGLNAKGYGIHGTNAPASIGKAASHGCIRLRNRDMERLFSMLRTGDVVHIRGERDAEMARLFGDGEDLIAADSEQQESGQ
jgi:lipoprotein-anchoring transpeptidase ErfK/SrfK